ncbi:MAG: NADP-dependent oxidoreductase [Betaproteobacteria bacterium]|nr:NADP-dependent oxidoreductase [Betaproteobacteria bacterium]
MTRLNRQYRLAARPVGLPKNTDWKFTTEQVADPGDGQVLVKVLQLSLDPAMRGWMNEGRSYIPPVGIGEVMRAGGVGKVIASKNLQFPVGDHVSGGFGIQEYCLVDGKDLGRTGLAKLDLRLGTLSQWLNALGMPGMTGYFGLLEVGTPKAGDTVVVSGAAGAVGQTVGQVAKIKGCRVVGIAGGKAKCDFVVRDLHFDACIDYKGGSVRDGLKEHCAKGVDIYFDNVGGEILDAVLARINRGARIVICGAISQYNNTTPVKGPANYLSLLINRARMEGMVVFDYADRYALAVKDIAQWMKDGKFVSKEDVVTGIENFPDTLNKLFSGENFGKLVLKVAEE